MEQDEEEADGELSWVGMVGVTRSMPNENKG